MTIPIAYSLRNLIARRLTTVLTAGGMALVVFVYACVLMLDTGLRATLVATGEPDNVILVRRGAEVEIQSGVDRAQAAIIESQPEVAIDGEGRRLVSKETVVLIALPKLGTGVPTNVVIRGIGEQGGALRPQVRLSDGRLFRTGASELIVGRPVAERFGTAPGSTLTFAGRKWTIVGIFDAGGSGFDSEIWGDEIQLGQAFRRGGFSSVVVRLADRAAFADFKVRVEADPRLTVDAHRERAFYEEQSRMLANFIRILGVTLSVIFSIGAMIGAMITMYAAVANRTAEIGALRALGFRRGAILTAFLGEAMLLALAGWAVGLGLASAMQLVRISTLNWTSFSELAFGFVLTPQIVTQSLVFAAAMGLAGGVLPALRAARLSIVDALRAA